VNSYSFSSLIIQILRAGYINFGDLANSDLNNVIGIPQGSLLSPLFCNILLNEFDKFILKVCNEIFVERVKFNSVE